MHCVKYGLLAGPLCFALAVSSCSTTGGPGSPRVPKTYRSVKAQAEATFASIASKRVLDAAMHYPKAETEPVQELPMALTAGDGTGLALVSLRAKVVVEGPLAFTELHLGFYNPEDRIREGRFSITLPPTAAISRLAMKMSENFWQEAEVVERQQARQIYEDFLHRKQDPALLEKQAGNQFQARVFPIPARGHKELKISYSEQLAALDQPYRLFLKGLPVIKQLEIQALVAEEPTQDASLSSLGGELVSHKVIRLSKADFAPDRDFVIKPRSRIMGLRHQNLAVLRVTPSISDKPAPLDSLLVLFDTSASRAAGFYRQVEELGALIHHLAEVYGAEKTLHVACFDQVVGSIYEGPLGEFTRRDLEVILARRPLGASNLQRALQWVGTMKGFDRVLLVTDGIATAGNTDPAALRSTVQGWAGQVKRLDALLAGGIRDESTMKLLLAGTLAHDGVLLDGEEPPKVLARRLSRQTLSRIRVTVPGARWTWPKQLDGVQPGAEVLVFAEMNQNTASTKGPLSVVLGGNISQKISVKAADVQRPLLERAWVEGRIASLQHQLGSGNIDPDMSQAVRQQIIELSRKHRVLSDYTALLVLETERDYARYGLQRNALADILVVGSAGVEVKHRQDLMAEKEKDLPLPIVRDDDARVRAKSSGASQRADLSARFSEQVPTGNSQSPRPDNAPVARSEAPPPAAAAEAISGEDRPRMSAPSRQEAVAEPRRSRPARRKAAAQQRPPSAAKRRARRADVDDELDGLVERPRPRPEPAQPKTEEGPPALTGPLAEITALIHREQQEEALVKALRWRAEQPGDVLALIALGEALQAMGRPILAARVYGSIIDLFPARADMLRFAGERLEALGPVELDLARDAYEQAVKQRPDHQIGHHLLGMALLRLGRLEEALTALERGLSQSYRIDRAGTMRILQEDLGLVAAALASKEPQRGSELEQRLSKSGTHIARGPSLRFVLNWETDANDVDFHIHDGQGGHAYYSSMSLPSGGSLYADVRNGYGPECFTVEGPAQAFPYELKIHYYSRGPMGYGMGKLQIIQHDGQGQFRFEDRPFVVMNDRAYVNLGLVKGPL